MTLYQWLSLLGVQGILADLSDKFDVFQSRKIGHQVIGLEDKADKVPGVFG